MNYECSQDPGAPPFPKTSEPTAGLDVEAPQVISSFALDLAEKMLARTAENYSEAMHFPLNMIQVLARALLATEAENAALREALDWIEAEPEDPLKVQLWARAALAAPQPESADREERGHGG